MEDTKQISVWLDLNCALPKVDFTSIDIKILNSMDIVGQLISGEIPSIEFKRNFQRCAFRESTANGLQWGGVDYKDTIFVDSIFIDCIFENSSTVSCTLTNCRFERCSFGGVAIHDTHYIDCTFIGVDFKHSMFRNSKITNCYFIDCDTSNKLFDGCQLDSNSFKNTLLDFRAILDNFGLDKSQITENLVRQDRAHPDSIKFDFENKLSDKSWVESLSSFEKIKVQYYLDNGEMHGSDVIDAAFDAQEWLHAVRAPINLMRLLQDFSDFLLTLYANNKLPVIFVVKIAQLSHSLWGQFTLKESYSQVSNAAAGIYTSCIKWLESFDCAIAEFINTRKSELRLRSSDDATDKEIQELVDFLWIIFPTCDVKIMPRNSPVDIVFNHMTPEMVTMMATLFFCTKTRLRLSRHSETKNDAAKKDGGNLINLSIGGAQGVLHNALLVQTTLPGSLFIRLDVNYSSKIVEKLRKTIKDII